MEGQGCLPWREKYSYTIPSLFTHTKEKASEGSTKHAGGGGGFNERIERLSPHLRNQVFRSALASIFLAILSAHSTI